MKTLIAGCIAFGLMASAFAYDDDDESGFYGLRISAGYQFGVNMKTKLKMRAVSGRPKAEAYANASGRAGEDPEKKDAPQSVWISDDGGFIVKDDGSGRSDSTVNWRLPRSARKADQGEYAVFEMHNSYQTDAAFEKHDDSVMHGASVETALTIARDGDWGMDLFIGFSWMRGVKCFDASGYGRDSYGNYTTRVKVDRNLLAHAPDSPYYSPGSGYGWGSPAELGSGPDLYLSDISAPIESSSGDIRYSGSGDYDEYDLYGGVKIWYEDEEYKWFRTTATIGAGVCYGEFDFAMNAISSDGGLSVRESFKDHDWSAYGLLGLGFVMTYGGFDFSFDAFWRYGQDAHKIRSKYVNGEIDRPEFFFRAAMGYNF